MSLFNHHQVVSTDSCISISEERETRPEFKRIYKAVLSPKARITIKARTTMFGDRSFDGELTQPNGRWVLFDPFRIADKILDPTLVPLVEETCKAIFALDRQYMDPPPQEFVDESGTRWTRAA